MKLLIVGPYPFRNNGISKFIDQYRSELLRRGHAVETESMYFWADKRTAFRWRSLRARLAEGFDAVVIQHTPTASGPLLPRFLKDAARRGTRTIVVGHEMPSVYAKHLPRFLRPLYHAYERAVFSRAAARIVHSDLHVRELRAIGVDAPVTVMPLPIYSSRGAADRPETGRPYWGYYGMISSKKGVDLLLEAYQSRPPGHYPPLRLLGGAAPGNEAYLESLHKQVGEPWRGHIDFRGYVEENALSGELSQLRLIVLPYRWASQSAALSEACQHRIPYLASDIPFFEDYNRRHGCGRLFRDGSVEALAAALDRERESPQDPDTLPFDRILDEFSLARCADRLLAEVRPA